mmetsp:Transcript_17615/g.19819  ORF Transcript_17615/g.19819 Transcript_17615/m.19819 type:complete len:89 (+) Transcript_17615:111-377(+)
MTSTDKNSYISVTEVHSSMNLKQLNTKSVKKSKLDRRKSDNRLENLDFSQVQYPIEELNETIVKKIKLSRKKDNFNFEDYKISINTDR